MKKHTTVTISLSIVICLMLSLLPGVTHTAAVSHTLVNSKDDVYILAEDTSLRKKFEKHFLMSDGSYQVALYDEPVHKEENGKWVEIDNTLKLQNPADRSSQYITTNGLADISFAQNFGDKLVTLQQGDYSVTW